MGRWKCAASDQAPLSLTPLQLTFEENASESGAMWHLLCWGMAMAIFENEDVSDLIGIGQAH